MTPKPATPRTNTNGYVTLAQLTALKPPEADVSFGGRTYRVRAMTSGEIEQIIRLTRADPLPLGDEDDFGDRQLTVAFGLIQPSVGAHADLAAARGCVESMGAPLRDTLCAAIRRLTRGIPAAEPGPESEPEPEPDDDSVTTEPASV